MEELPIYRYWLNDLPKKNMAMFHSYVWLPEANSYFEALSSFYHRFIIVLSSFHWFQLRSSACHDRDTWQMGSRLRRCAPRHHGQHGAMMFFHKTGIRKKDLNTNRDNNLFFECLLLYIYIYISKTISIICLYSLEVSIVYLRFLLTYHWNTSCTDDSIYNETGDSCNDQKKFWDRCL